MTKQLRLAQTEPGGKKAAVILSEGRAGPVIGVERSGGRGLCGLPPPRSFDFALRAPLRMTLVNLALSAPPGALGVLRMTLVNLALSAPLGALGVLRMTPVNLALSAPLGALGVLRMAAEAGLH